MSLIQNAADPDVNLIFGALVDEKMKDEVKITLIATGFQEAHASKLERGIRVPSVAAPVAQRAVARPPPPPEPIQLRDPLPRIAPGRTVPKAVRPPGKAASDLPGLEEQYDIPAFLRRNPAKSGD
jgi:cell division protein FtsZ